MHLLAYHSLIVTVTPIGAGNEKASTNRGGSLA
jgi:hypothetical protein